MFAAKYARLNCRIPGHFKAIPLKQWLRGYAATRLRGYAATRLRGYGATQNSRSLRWPIHLLISLFPVQHLLRNPDNSNFIRFLYSFPQPGKLRWFLYLILSYLVYDPSMFIYRRSSNFIEKIVLERKHGGRDAISCLLLCVLFCMEGEFEEIISKIRLSIKDNIN